MLHYTNSTNGSDSAVDESSSPEVFVIVNCVTNVPLMFVAIIGNTLVLAAILKTPSRDAKFTFHSFLEQPRFF